MTTAEGARADEMRLLELARDGDESAFSNLARAYGVELRAHCYQMTGSLADAEDALQEGLLRAWAGLRTFEGRGSFRSWLYAVVTNAALDLIRRRSRRELPVPFGSSAASQADPGVPLPEHPWLDPHSEHWLADDARRSPEARYEERESVEFAFSVALHHLPPLQRTALLLREVVGLSAAEIAVQLGTTTPSVNSALQRARVAVRSGLHVGSEEPVSRALSDERTRATVHRYANAIERGDSDALISMLTRDVVPCQLPGVGAQFAGRAAELAELDRLLDGADSSMQPLVILISGTAGVGKTALAVHWAQRVASRFGGGQLFVNLNGYEPGGDPVPAGYAMRSLLEALRVPPGQIPADPKAQRDLYKSLLAKQRVLIVLDNARDADHVRPLLPDEGGCLVVVTSRGQLPSLAVSEGAHPLRLDVLTRTDARGLLANRLGSERLGTGAEVDELIELCARLPLALSVTAAQAAEHPDFPLRSLVARLRDERRRLDALAAGEPVSSVRSAFWCSYRQLSGPAARMFRLLSVHRGPDLTVAAAASLAGVPEESGRQAVGELARAGLLAEHPPGRFACHDLLRNYAAELARARDRATERHAALRRVLDYYLQASLALARSVEPCREHIHVLPPAEGVASLSATASANAVAWFDAERPVLMAAIARAAQEGLDAHAWQLAWATENVLARSGRWQAMIAICRVALLAAGRAGDLPGQAQMLRALGRAVAHLGAIDEGISYLARALELFDQLDDNAAHARGHLDISGVVFLAGRYRDAIRHAERARDLYRAADHRVGQAVALNNISWFRIQLGSHHEALADAQRALAEFQQLRHPLLQSIALDNVGLAHHHLGDHAHALAYLHAALCLTRQLQDELRQAEILIHLGDVHYEVGDHIAAGNCWRKALSTLEELNPTQTDMLHARLRDLGQDRTTAGDWRTQPYGSLSARRGADVGATIPGH